MVASCLHSPKKQHVVGFECTQPMLQPGSACNGCLWSQQSGKWGHRSNEFLLLECWRSSPVLKGGTAQPQTKASPAKTDLRDWQASWGSVLTLLPSAVHKEHPVLLLCWAVCSNICAPSKLCCMDQPPETRQQSNLRFPHLLNEHNLNLAHGAQDVSLRPCAHHPPGDRWLRFDGNLLGGCHSSFLSKSLCYLMPYLNHVELASTCSLSSSFDLDNQSP